MTLDGYISQITSDDFISTVAENTGHELEKVSLLIKTYANEAHVGYSLISEHLRSDCRFLEVGAGVGVLAAYLHLSGYKVVAIEPSGKGFDLNYAIGSELRDLLDLDNFQYLDLGVEDLLVEALGEFDCIYSVNVVEHLPDLALGFERMSGVLGPNGIMIHTCPNYIVPYEPHFGLLLVPFAPKVTEYFLHDRLTSTGLWRSLNFVTSGTVSRLAKDVGLNIHFVPRVMYNSILRIGEDPLFAERQGGFILAIYKFLTWTRLVLLLKFWPASWATPMIFTCEREA